MAAGRSYPVRANVGSGTPEPRPSSLLGTERFLEPEYVEKGICIYPVLYDGGIVEVRTHKTLTRAQLLYRARQLIRKAQQAEL